MRISLYSLTFKRKVNRAQAFYEFIISLTVVPVFIAIILSLTRLYVAKIRCLQAARHGAFLMATGKVSESKMKTEVRQFMKDSGFDTSRLTIPSPEEYKLNIWCPVVKVTVKYRVKVFDIGKLSFWGSKTKIDKQFEESVVCGKPGIF